MNFNISAYSAPDAGAYGAFAILFWVKAITAGAVIFSSLGGTRMDVVFQDASTILINLTGSAGWCTFTLNNAIAGAWTHIALIRTRARANVQAYQDGVLLGSDGDGSGFGSDTFLINSDGAAFSIFDLRVRADEVSQGAVKYMISPLNMEKVLP